LISGSIFVPYKFKSYGTGKEAGDKL